MALLLFLTSLREYTIERLVILLVFIINVVYYKHNILLILRKNTTLCTQYALFCAKLAIYASFYRYPCCIVPPMAVCLPPGLSRPQYVATVLTPGLNSYLFLCSFINVIHILQICFLLYIFRIMAHRPANKKYYKAAEVLTPVLALPSDS